jgi:CRP-like cAMP-binding protein
MTVKQAISPGTASRANGAGVMPHTSPSKRLRQHLQEEGVRVQRARHEFLFVEGRAADAIYFLNDGIVAITNTGDGGHREIYGFIFGPAFIIPPVGPDHIAHHSAECLSNVDLHVMSRLTLDRIVEVEPEVGIAVQHELSRAVRMAHNSLSNLLSHHGMERVAFILSSLQETAERARGTQATGTDTKVDDWIAITQLDLSAAIGMTPVYLNQILKKMKQSRLIELKSGKIRVLDNSEIKRCINKQI